MALSPLLNFLFPPVPSVDYLRTAPIDLRAEAGVGSSSSSSIIGAGLIAVCSILVNASRSGAAKSLHPAICPVSVGKMRDAPGSGLGTALYSSLRDQLSKQGSGLIDFNFNISSYCSFAVVMAAGLFKPLNFTS